MKGIDRERWHELCEQVPIEQDAERLLELAREIKRLLEQKLKGLDKQSSEAAE
jgi:hypothetical protein